MPQKKQKKPTGFGVYAFPTKHKQIKVDGSTRMAARTHLPGENICARCSQLAQRDGQMGWYHVDGRTPSKSNKWVRKMPDGVRNIPHTYYGCSICRVYLCRLCFRMEDEQGNPHPERWDHDEQQLLARCLVCN